MQKETYFSCHGDKLDKYGNIKIGIQSYIKEAIEKFGVDVSRGVKSPATSRSFDVTEGVEKLLEEEYSTFHSTVAKLLWTMKRLRPDIGTAISFIYT